MTSHDIFISYSSSNRETAALLVDCFQLQNWTVWWDRRIQPGEFFDIAVEGALQSSATVVLLWSIKANESTWVRAEAESAASRKVLFPVLLDSTALPLHLQRIQSADLTKWVPTEPHTGLRSLLEALSAKLNRPLVSSGLLPSAQQLYGDGLRAEAQGEIAEAVGHYLHALRIDPAFEPAQQRLQALAKGERTLPVRDPSSWDPLGSVVWFHRQKGYGFIQADDGGAPFFVHTSAVEASGLETLLPDQRVEFRYVAKNRRAVVTRIRLIARETIEQGERAVLAQSDPAIRILPQFDSRFR
jgi:CspA family cold shock protein